MSIADAADNLRSFPTNGATSAFALTNLIFRSSADLVVRFDSAAAAPVTWTQGVHYTLAGDSLAGNATLTALGAAPATGILYVERITPPRQETDLSDVFKITDPVVEGGLDDLARQIGDVSAHAARLFAAAVFLNIANIPASTVLPVGAVTLPIADTAHVIGWNDEGQLTNYVAADMSSLAVTITDGIRSRFVADKLGEAYVAIYDFLNPIFNPPADNPIFMTAQTAALNAAWVAGGGKPIFLNGDETKIYRFNVSALASRSIRVFGRASYRLSETSYTDEYGVVIAVSNSLTPLWRASRTPQFLYAPPQADGTRNLNIIDAPDAINIDPAFFGASFIQGNESCQELRTGGNLMCIGHNQLEQLEIVAAGTVIGRRQLRYADFLNRVVATGTENCQRGFTYRPSESGHPNFTTLTEARDTSVQDVWLKTATIGSGERAWMEEDAAVLNPATTYTLGQGVVKDGRGYHALAGGLLGSNFDADLAAGWWRDLGLRTKTTYDGTGFTLPANIATVGRAGTVRLPRYRDPAYPGAWQMGIFLYGRDNLHNCLDGSMVSLFGYGNAGSVIFAAGVNGVGNFNFSSRARSLEDVHYIGTRIGDNMIFGKRLVLGGTAVLKWTSRARDMTVLGDDSGVGIGCSTVGGANPMTFELEADEPYAAQYGAIVGPANCRIVPNGFTSSFIGGYGNFNSATIVSNDIVIGHLNMVTATGTIGGRIVIANRHPNTSLDKFLSIGHFAYAATRPLISGCFVGLGVLFNAHAAADMATATTCDQIIHDVAAMDRAGGTVRSFFADYLVGAGVKQAWSGGGTTRRGFLIDITDTSSAASSMLLDGQVGGLSKASIRKDGQLTLAGGVIQTPPASLTLTADDTIGFEFVNATTVNLKGRKGGATKSVTFTLA